MFKQGKPNCSAPVGNRSEEEVSIGDKIFIPLDMRIDASTNDQFEGLDEHHSQ